MLNKKRTKVSRHRGSSSHGWGHKKKHRGAGHRGGVGLSGTGARGDQKKSMILTSIGKSYYGKHGFKSVRKTNNTVLSLNYIENHFEKLVEVGLIVKEGNEFVFNSIEAGYDKILGKGTFTKKITLICNDISEAAKQRVEEAGGKVVVEGSEEDDFEEEKVDESSEEE